MHDLRALVVDDSKVGRLTMLRKLESMGMRVDLAESGPQCLDHLEQQRPDLIFMDHMMPDMDGFEVTRRIKASPRFRDIPVIIVSGNDEAEFVREAIQAGALDAIAKPPATDVLEKLLASLHHPAPLAAVASPALPAAAPPPVPAATGPSREQVREMLEEVRAELLSRFDTRLAEREAAQAMLEQRVAELESLASRLATLEHRLHATEAVATRSLPDFVTLRADLDKRIDAGLAALQAREAEWASMLGGLRQDLTARMDEHADRARSESAALQRRIEDLGGELGRLAGDLRSTSETLSARIGGVESAGIQEDQAQPAGQTEHEEAALFQVLQSELEALNERVSESRLRQLVTEAASRVEPGPHPRDTADRSELAGLRGEIKRLRVLALIGGAVLLGAIGLALFLT